MEEDFIDKLVELENLYETFSDALKFCSDESKNAAYLVTLSDIIFSKLQKLTNYYEHSLFYRVKAK